MAGKCKMYLKFVSATNPIEGEPVPSQTQQIKGAASSGQVYPCPCSPKKTNRDNNTTNTLMLTNAGR